MGVGKLWEHMYERYTLNVKAVHKSTCESVTLSGSFRVFGHQEKYFCSADMINTEIQPIQSEYLEYISVGKARHFTCKIYGNNNTIYTPVNGPCKLNCLLLASCIQVRPC